MRSMLASPGSAFGNTLRVAAFLSSTALPGASKRMVCMQQLTACALSLSVSQPHALRAPLSTPKPHPRLP